MKIEALPDEFIEELLNDSAGVPLQSSSGISPLEDDSAPAETFACDFCGHCETPNDCAWAHECPICHAPAGKISMTTYCKTPTNGITSLHKERWHAHILSP